MSKKMVELFATFFYLGRSPVSPGTVGTIGAIPVVLLLGQLSPVAYMLVAFALVIFSIIVSQAYEQLVETHDNREIVIDEVVGFVVTMVWLPLTWQSLLLGFILFRVLDILKPFPISYLDKNVGGGVGVVVDDLLAGLIANIILQILYSQTDVLGVQLLF